MTAAVNISPLRVRLGRLVTIVMSMTVLSRLCGFLRDILFAQIFGATAVFDAFVIAFKIPNLMRRLFGEGAFSQAFIPVLAEYRAKHTPAAVQQFVNKITGTLALTALLVVIIGEIGAPLLVLVFAPGFSKDPARYHLAAQMVRITFPYVLSMTLVALAGAILNTYNRFALSAFTPVILNLVLISAALWWAPHVHAIAAIYVLAWGVLISGVIQLLVQIPALRQLGLLPKPSLRGREAGVRRVMKQMLPALLGVSMAQIGLLLDNVFASFLPAGSISWLYYSDRLIYLPLGVIGVALASVIMPNLSRQHHHGSAAGFSATLDWAMRCVILIAAPATIGLFILAGPILATLLHHGAFTAHDVWMTRRSLMAFTVGLPAFMMIKILASAFYSQHNIKTPVAICTGAILLNLLLNALLITPLAHAGLALATALASWLNAVLLWVFLQRQGIYRPAPGWLHLGLAVLVASGLMTGLLCWRMGRLTQWLTLSLSTGAARLAMLIILGISIYFIGLWVMGLRWRHVKPPMISG